MALPHEIASWQGGGEDSADMQIFEDVRGVGDGHSSTALLARLREGGCELPAPGTLGRCIRLLGLGPVAEPGDKPRGLRLATLFRRSCQTDFLPLGQSQDLHPWMVLGCVHGETARGQSVSSQGF